MLNEAAIQRELDKAYNNRDQAFSEKEREFWHGYAVALCGVLQVKYIKEPVIKLSPEASQKLVELLENPPEPNEALKAAFRNAPRALDESEELAHLRAMKKRATELSERSERGINVRETASYILNG